jgi:cytochrome c-type biogenesis protein CcmH
MPMHRLLPALAILLFASISAQADPAEPTLDKPFADPAQEAKARAFMREIRCVVCQSQSIDESDAEIAAQLRNAVREQMAAGRNAQEIRDYLVARYGDFVLMKPPFKGSTVVLWSGPFILAAIGVGWIVLQRRRRPSADAGGIFSMRQDLSESERIRLERLLADDDSGEGR